MLAWIVCAALENSFATFVDRSEELGLTLGNDAACWIDVDRDGYPDLVTAGVVWRNVKGIRFSKLAQVGGSCVAADFDNDGFPDLFCFSTQKLWRNDKGARFLEQDLEGIPQTVSRGACCGDFDKDGFVDIYVGGYEDWDKNITYPSLILKNEAGKTFSVVYTESTYRARGITACDFDRDADLDIYVSNYRLQPNRLWINDGKGKFVDEAGVRNAVATSPGFDGGHSIGAAWGDFDGDGEFDLFAGNFAHVDSRGDQPKSRFLKNLGAPGGYKFEDKGTCGVFYQESYASPAAADFDNDGHLDLFFTTVYAVASFNRPNYPVLFRNKGNFEFEDLTESAGLSRLGATYQAAWADFDRDGDMDLVTNGRLFVNQGNANNWLEVRLTGSEAANRSNLGAQIRVVLKGRVLARQVEAGTGEGNQNDLVVHFGLGKAKGPLRVEVTWPDGKKTTLRQVRENRLIEIKR